MKNLNKQLDQDRKVLTTQDLDNIEGAGDIGKKTDANEDLYYVLVEKTEGEAALRVNSGEPGEGIQAYMRVYLWFAGITGLALTEKTQLIMHPTPAKHDHEIADLLEGKNISQAKQGPVRKKTEPSQKRPTRQSGKQKRPVEK